jgi:alpha-L-fucosidase
MGNSWSYVPHDHYKSATQLIQLLIRIVSRGGNLLLNIGPSPDGDFDDTAYARLKEIGDWMAINGEAIYGTHPIRPYASGNICLTQSKDSLNSFAFYLGGPGDPTHPGNPDITLPAEISIARFTPAAKAKVTLLGVGSKTKLKWRDENHTMIISIPPSLLNKPVGQHAVVFRISA